MDPIYNQPTRYRPPRRPTLVRVRPSSRNAVLELMEQGPVLPRARLADLTEISPTTIRNTLRQLSHEGVLTPQSGRNGANPSIARYAVLPVLELSPRQMVWRLFETTGQSVFATVRDRGGFRTPEDDFTVLMGQVSTILRGGACGPRGDIPLQPPALICPDGEGFPELSLLRPLMAEAPTVILTPQEATARELMYIPAAREAETVLHLYLSGHDAEDGLPQITLFTRATAGQLREPFIPAPTAADFRPALRDSLPCHLPYSEGWWEQLAAFLQDLCRFIRLQCVILELDRPRDHTPLLRAALPKSVKMVRVRYDLNAPPLSHRGALRVTRRALWESMEGKNFP